MAEETRAFDEEVFQDEAGNLFVFRDGDFQPTTRQALETGPFEAAMVGAGETLTNIGRTLDPSRTGAEVAAVRAEDEAVLAPMQAERPISTGVGAALPFLATAPIGMGIGGPALTGARALAEQAAIGAGLGALEGGAPGALIGAGSSAAGFGLGKIAQRVLGARHAARGRLGDDILDTVDQADDIVAGGAAAGRAAPGPARTLTKAQRRAQAFQGIDEPRAPPGAAVGAARAGVHDVRVGQADSLGFELTTGERLNSDTLRQVEAGFRSSPFAPAKLRDVKASNQTNLNRHWGKAIGVGEVDNITDDVMGEAVERAGEKFTEAAEAVKGGKLGVSRLAAEVEAIRVEAGRGASIMQDMEVNKLLGEVEQWAQGPGKRVAARDFMAARSNLNKQMRDASAQGKGVLAEAMQDVIEAMDRTFEGAAGAEAAAIYKGARENWRFITALERGQTLNTATGNVNARTAGSSLKRVFKQEAGRGGVEDLSNAGAETIEATQVANYFGEIVGDSGTATRLSVQEILRNPVGATGGAVTRALGEGYNRIVAPALEAAARGRPTRGLSIGGGLGGQGASAGPLPLDI